MENKNQLVFGALIIMLGVFVLGIGFQKTNVPLDNSQGIDYEGSVCVTHTNADGEILMHECDHNVLFNTGKELVETAIGTGTADACDWIELCNATAGCGTPTADSSEDYTAYGAICGLDKVAGTVTSNGVGNWSVYNTFTSTCDSIVTNVTHLLNDADDEFAGNSFTLVTLQTNDQLTINWTVSVS